MFAFMFNLEHNISNGDFIRLDEQNNRQICPQNYDLAAQKFGL